MSYFGGKAQDGVYQAIINNIPLHDTYIEPFLGGGAIMKFKRPATVNLAIDRNIVVLNEFKSNCGNSVTFYCSDAIEWLPKSMQLFDVDTFIYLDPPYLHSTRSSKTRYRYELTEDDHIKLLEIIKYSRAKVAISTYPNELYKKMLSDWRVVPYSSVTRSGEQRIEHLYMNYKEPFILHDFRYLGKNANNRQDIKRRINRTQKNLSKWNHNERLYLLSKVIPKLTMDEKEFLQHRLNDL